MALWYVYSGAGGSQSGADWANAKLSIAAACAAAGGGDTIFVAHDHAPAAFSAAQAITLPGTSGSPSVILCVNRAGSVPPVSADITTGAAESTTGANNFNIGGFGWIQGITFTAGDAANNASVTFTAASNVTAKNCNFRIGNTTTTARISQANSNVRTRWINCTVQFGATSQSISMAGGVLEWEDTPSAVTGATIPTNLISTASAGTFILTGVDVSALGSSKNIGPASALALEMWLDGCPLNASVTHTQAPTLAYSTRIHFVDCDSGATNYKAEKTDYYGTLTTETSIVRTGGGSDGTQAVSDKIVTTANAKPNHPFSGEPIEVWNDTVGSAVTVTVEGNGASLPNNDDIWIDVYYFASNTTPRKAIATSGKADVLAAGAAVASSAASWAGGTTAFKMQATFTPQQKGILKVVPRVGKASATYYVDGKVALS